AKSIREPDKWKIRTFAAADSILSKLADQLEKDKHLAIGETRDMLMHRDNPDDIAGLFGIPETFLPTSKQGLDFIRLLRIKKVSEDALRDAARKLYDSDFG